MPSKSKILLLYVFPHHHSSVERLSDEMVKRRILVDVLDVSEFSSYKKTLIKWPIAIAILRFLFLHNTFFFKVCRKLFYNVTIKQIINKYDYVDFHYYSGAVDLFAPYCVKNGKKFDITLWGSDFLRASKERREKMKYGFSHAHYIKSMKSVLEELSSTYQGEYDDKAAYVDFGNSQFEYIDAITDEKYKTIDKETYPTCNQPIVITLGYNGSTHQNHFTMIEAVSKLPQVVKDKLHIIIPLTYGCDEQYVQKIGEAIKSTGTAYSIPTNYMGHDEIAVLRKKSDITINLQDTDAFSFSLQEHLYCGNIMIIADWLNYPELKDSDIFYLKANKENLIQVLSDVLNKYKEYKELSASNKEKIEHIISWKYMSKNWAQLYES